MNRQKKCRGWRNKAFRQLREDYINALRIIAKDHFGDSGYASMDYAEKIVISYRQGK